MIKEAIGYGDTIEEALEDARLQLGAKPEDDVEFEVLSTPKKKVLGIFGGAKAEVKAFIELPDAAPKKAPRKRNEKAPVKPEKKDKKPAQKKAVEAEKKPAKAEAPAVVDDFSDAVDEAALAADSQAAKAVSYLRTILEQFACKDVAIKVAEREGCTYIMLDGEGLGVIIGHRGETLDALQYLVGLAANGAGGYYKVSLNIGDYRQRREQTLTDLAKRVSEQVLRTGKNRTLEPMNPYERRIIHTAVQNIEGVVSNSFGEGSGRRVVIAVEGGDIRPQRRDGGRGRNSGRGRRNDRPSNKVEAPVREPKKDIEAPLYGKIN
ncbi:MAG: Jag N-terminal domain-containing protein [Oscillospiraceae bacterium]|nr:Jag N-terminal domain-containing protein [Oscillospiraceae bacterium]